MKLFSALGLAALSLAAAACTVTTPICQESADNLGRIAARADGADNAEAIAALAAAYADLGAIAGDAEKAVATDQREQLLCRATTAQAAMLQAAVPLDQRPATTAPESPTAVAVRAAAIGVELCSSIESQDQDRCVLVRAIAAAAPSRAALDQLHTAAADASSTSDAVGWRRAEGLITEFTRTTEPWTPALERAGATNDPAHVALTRGYLEPVACGVQADADDIRSRSPGEDAAVLAAATSYATAYFGAMNGVADALDLDASAGEAFCAQDADHPSCRGAKADAVRGMCARLTMPTQ